MRVVVLVVLAILGALFVARGCSDDAPVTNGGQEAAPTAPSTPAASPGVDASKRDTPDAKPRRHVDVDAAELSPDDDETSTEAVDRALNVVVLEPSGQPASDARVQFANDGTLTPRAVMTDGDGHARLDPPRDFSTARILVRHPSAIAHLSPPIDLDSPPQGAIEVRLVAPQIISGVVLDEAGNPVKARVSAALEPSVEWVGLERHVRLAGWSNADAAGRFELSDLRPGEWRLTAEVRDRRRLFAQARAAAGTEGVRLVVRRPPGVYFEIVDAATGEPLVTDELIVFTVGDDGTEHPNYAISGGALAKRSATIKVNSTIANPRLRVSAIGYLPGDVIDVEEYARQRERGEEVTVRIELHRDPLGAATVVFDLTTDVGSLPEYLRVLRMRGRSGGGGAERVQHGEIEMKVAPGESEFDIGGLIGTGPHSSPFSLVRVRVTAKAGERVRVPVQLTQGGYVRVRPDKRGRMLRVLFVGDAPVMGGRPETDDVGEFVLVGPIAPGTHTVGTRRGRGGSKQELTIEAGDTVDFVHPVE